MKVIKRCLISNEIRITKYAERKMSKRGYTRSDIISGIHSGTMTRNQLFNGDMRVVIEGKDTDGLPIVLVIGKDKKSRKGLAIVTVFPPIQDKFSRVI